MKVWLRITVIAVAFLALRGGAVFAQPSFLEFLQGRQMGRPAPDFTLATLKGEKVNMTKYRDGKKAIVFFWATWCPHCRVALKDLNRIYAEIEKKGIKLIVVDLAETKEEVAYYAKKNKLVVDVFLDTEGELAEPYGIIGVPTFYFIDEAGAIRAIEHSLPKDLEKAFAKAR